MKKIPFIFLLLPLLSFAQQKTELKTWQFYSEKDSVPQEVNIPHTWNATDAFDDEPGYWRGKGIYTTSITVTDTSKVHYLKFNGANQVAKLYVNGKYVGEHFGGYTAFQFRIDPYLKLGENKVKLELDNSNDETVPPLDADFTFYGGMYRKAFLIAENKEHFAKENGADAVKISTLPVKSSGVVKFSAVIENPQKKELFLQVNFEDEKGNEIYSKQERVGDRNFNSAFKFDRPQLWSPGTPYLYDLQLKLTDKNGSVLDSYTHKIGFRTLDASVDGFRLNGQKLKLIGVNRHQDWEGLGNAVPVEKQLQDMVKIKEMGANFVRLAHYPQAEEIYKAADSLGLILWSEIPVVNKVPATQAYFGFEEHALQMQREQIAQHGNHTSLVFLGYMNEIFLRMVFDKNEGKERQAIIDRTLELAKKLEDLTRKLAPDRITVMAVHGSQVYNETGIADIPMVLGWNLYFGWYGGELNDLGTFLDKEHREHPTRPLIISEYGVGADDRLHSQQPEIFDFTEEYQLKYHQAYLRQLLARDYVIGMTAWNFADFGSEFRGDTRPHINEKGLLNYDRTPKNIYYWYKAMLKHDEKFSRFYREAPVYISNSPQKELKIISNQPVYVELNGTRITKGRPEEGIIDFSVNLQPGENELKVFNAQEELQDTMLLEWQKPDFSVSKFLALNFGTNAFFTAEDGRVWIPAEASGIVKTEGQTEKIKSSTNIRETEEEPIYQTALSKIRSLKLEVPAGNYKVSLFFSNLGKDKALVYELKDEEASAEPEAGNFSLRVNGKSVEIGKIEEFHKVEKELELKTSGEIRIEAPAGKAFATNGILLEKTD